MPKPTASWIIRALFKHKVVIMDSDAWKEFEITGIYNTNNVYRELKGANPTVPWKNLIRGNWARPRSIFVLWMACQKRLQTKDRLARFGTMTDGKCLFCGEIETCDHLLFACRFTKDLWKQVITWMQLYHMPQEWDSELKWCITVGRGKSHRAKLIKICLAETVYYVWINRNKGFFQQATDKELVFQEIKVVVLERIQLDRKLRDYCNVVLAN
ncbi:uncharacterized protein LOC131620076 [Vicia villosa]|uniref:uncharacterized protein LOC131620076 n=1 Tax=Vicia villosa TaxID=3911 RepID=UPI00273B9A64|nr:uncharacterized protein LOC131620076 [Vicia villosa]